MSAEPTDWSADWATVRQPVDNFETPSKRPSGFAWSLGGELVDQVLQCGRFARNDYLVRRRGNPGKQIVFKLSARHGRDCTRPSATPSPGACSYPNRTFPARAAVSR